MVKVLFVCLGNICRSPMAEAIFRHKVKERGLENVIHVDSAGTGDWHIGKGPHQGTCQVLEKNNIDYTGLVARQVCDQDWQDFDYIIAMDSRNVADLEYWKKGEPRAKCYRMLDFLPEEQERDVPDPFYDGRFEYVYDLLNRSCEAFLEHLIREEGIEVSS